jgi:hypothetical protein
MKNSILDEDQAAKAASYATLLSRRQIAERWQCCEHTIARRKDLRPLRFNRRLIRYRLEDVEAIEAAAAEEYPDSSHEISDKPFSDPSFSISRAPRKTRSYVTAAPQGRP